MAAEHLDLLEQVFDKKADTLIVSEYATPTIVQENQKTIRNGIIQTARESLDTLVLYQKDIKANKEDLIQTTTPENGGQTLDQIVENIYISNPAVSIDSIIISVTSEGQINMEAPDPYNLTFNITTLLSGENPDGTINPVNISQFVSIDNKKSSISPEQANEFLDTNIYELLTGVSSRQERINKFFDEFQNLVGNYPFTSDGWPDEDGDGLLDMATQYDGDNDITQNPNNPNAYITRLDETVAQYEDTQNEAQTLQSLRDILNNYLRDIDDAAGPPQDQRPEYQNQSSGYLKFRNLNQGIIIRNVNNEFVEGFNPDSNEYLSSGFTITMWVRFLDKVSEGTLFNFANPIRTQNPFGFRLDTHIFQDRRFLRLLVLDVNGVGAGATSGVPQYYDSHVAMEGSFDGTTLEKKTLGSSQSNLQLVHPTQYTEVPMDFTDWYFICATYNPMVDEINSTYSVLDSDYWRNNMVDNGTSIPTSYTSFSYYGNRSKVEIISKNDLLRARGYKSSDISDMSEPIEQT